jgi:dTDP-4-dehydrorhamnose reductase
MTMNNLKIKVLVLGHRGMLGHRVFEDLSDSFNVLKNDLNIFAQKEEFNSFLLENKPEIVINCIGLIKPSCDKSTREEIVYINSLFPHLLKKIVNSYNGKVIHVSTDCVFDGIRGDYSVTDNYSAKDLYGISKALGEIIDDKNLTLRTSIIGRELPPNNKSLVEWFLKQEECNGFANHIWNGVTTDYFAKKVKEIILSQPTLSGLQQLSSVVPVNKYELLCLLKERYNKNTKITRVDAKESINRRLIPTVSAPPVSEMIREMK